MKSLVKKKPEIEESLIPLEEKFRLLDDYMMVFKEEETKLASESGWLLGQSQIDHERPETERGLSRCGTAAKTGWNLGKVREKRILNQETERLRTPESEGLEGQSLRIT